MFKNELILVIGAIALITFTFIVGVIVFVIQYRRRKIMHEQEKEQIEKQHQLDLLNVQLESQKQTMQFIGQEIHDSVAQKITLASIYTQQMEFAAGGTGETNSLSGINKILNDALAELRMLSRNLTDQKIQQAGLAELVMLECDQVNATHVCRAVCRAGPLPAVDIATKSTLLRIVQEFIQNSIRHSGCSTITVQLSEANGRLSMSACDDGRGFDLNSTNQHGVGLDSIRRRVQSLGGTHRFESGEGRGTCLYLELPLHTNVIKGL